MTPESSTHTCACGGNCGCQDEQSVERIYLTRDEYVARLEDYLLRLKNEIVSVEDELEKLKQAV